MDREVPFEPDLICDKCGAVGAYDFMGDIFCWECMGKESEDIEVFDTLEEAIYDLNDPEPALDDVNHWAKWVVMQRLGRMIVKNATEPEPVDWEGPRLE